MKNALVISLVTVALVATGCRAPEGRIDASGRVVDDTVAVGAPALPSPVPDVSAAIDASATPASAPRGSAVATLTGLGQRVKVTSVRVAVGDRVKAGEVVATLDDRALAGNIDAANAWRSRAKAQVRVIDARLGDLRDARATISSSRATVSSAIGTLISTRAQLVGQLAQAKAQLAQLEALQARIRRLPQPPPGGVPPTGTPRPPVPPGPLPNPAQIAAGIAALTVGIGKLEAGLAKIDAGLAKATAGLVKLNAASATLADARSALRNARDVTRVVAQGTTVGVDLAKLQRDLAVVRAPIAGDVIATVQPGEVLAPGAPVVTLRPLGASRVDVWVAPGAAAGIRVGDSASVRIDSAPGRDFSAKVSEIGVRATYPPSFLATTDVHLTRAIPVRVTLDDPSEALPPGTPADVSIKTGQ